MIFVLPFLASIITVGAFKAGGGDPLVATFDMALLQTPGLVFLVPLRFIVSDSLLRVVGVIAQGRL